MSGVANSVLDRQFLVISGKGGVGRTTVAAVLARVAERAGKRVLIAQMDAPAGLSSLLGHATPIGPAVVAIRDGLSAVNMNPRTALLQYAAMALHYETLAKALLDNKAARSFLAAVPGLDAYAMLGKAWWHSTEMFQGRPRYDLIVLDAPASGHAMTMLKIPRAILDVMPKGPLGPDAAALLTMLTDPLRSAFVIVTRAEDLPVRETAELAQRVRDELQLPLGPIFVNAVPPAFLGEPCLGIIPTLGDQSPLAATLRSVNVLHHRRIDAVAQLACLAQRPGLPLIELPALPVADLGPAQIDDLAALVQDRLSSS